MGNRMGLIIHAVNIHQGGGRTLLLSLIDALTEPSRLLLDERFELIAPFNINASISKYPPSLFSRLKAELYLRKVGKSENIILCFGNLPPLFKSRAKVFLYLQNRYLCSSESLSGFSIKVRIRILLERQWIKLFLRDATILVQSETMRKNTLSFFGRDALVMPFLPKQSTISNKDQTKGYDFLYVASGEPHKNHLNLINAWVILSKHGLFPSLRLTLSDISSHALIQTIESHKNKYGLKIINSTVESSRVGELYMQSHVLIYPSLFESFGLPLIEANNCGLPIIASERDYVRDVVQPIATFDPESEVSIARAVMRYMGNSPSLQTPMNAELFLKNLLHSNL